MDEVKALKTLDKAYVGRPGRFQKLFLPKGEDIKDALIFLAQEDSDSAKTRINIGHIAFDKLSEGGHLTPLVRNLANQGSDTARRIIEDLYRGNALQKEIFKVECGLVGPGEELTGYYINPDKDQKGQLVGIVLGGRLYGGDDPIAEMLRSIGHHKKDKVLPEWRLKVAGPRDPNVPASSIPLMKENVFNAVPTLLERAAPVVTR